MDNPLEALDELIHLIGEDGGETEAARLLRLHAYVVRLQEVMGQVSTDLRRWGSRATDSRGRHINVQACAYADLLDSALADTEEK